jgi:hypothetical protein
MQYQIFVESRSARHFVASVIGMPTVSVDGDTEIEAISKPKFNDSRLDGVGTAETFFDWFLNARSSRKVTHQ